jgi:hypothetical protein
MQYDIAILTTFHSAYQALRPAMLKHLGIRLVIDGRNGFDPSDLTAAGIKYIGIGRGGVG